MFFQRLRQRIGMEPGERARQEHSAWLTRAVRTERAYPRIPVRPVAAGGFDPVLQRPGGRDFAHSWWSTALARVDEIEDAA